MKNNKPYLAKGTTLLKRSFARFSTFSCRYEL